MEIVFKRKRGREEDTLPPSQELTSKLTCHRLEQRPPSVPLTTISCVGNVEETRCEPVKDGSPR